MHPSQLPVSLLFCTFFKISREKPKTRSRVRPPGHKSTSKWTSRAPKRSPRINNLRPKVPSSTNSRGRVLAEGDVDPPRYLNPKIFKQGVPSTPQHTDSHPCTRLGWSRSQSMTRASYNNRFITLIGHPFLQQYDTSFTAI